MYTSRSETTSRFSGGKMLARRCGTPPRQGKQSVWTPTAKAAGAKRIYFGGRSPALTRPPLLLRNGDDDYLTKQGRKRNRKKSFWVTEGEWKAIEKIAAGTGMGIGEYLRISALGKTIYQIEELKPVLHELKCISRNLNQLTMLSHQGVIRMVNLNATADGIGRCYEAINRLYADTDAVIQSGG